METSLRSAAALLLSVLFLPTLGFSISFECNEEGRFGHPTDCGSFIDCVWNSKTGLLESRKGSCGKGGFDSQEKKCVDRRKIKGCSLREARLDLRRHDLNHLCTFGSDFVCSDCNTLVHCMDGVAFSQSCSVGDLCQTKEIFGGAVCHPDPVESCSCKDSNVFKKDPYHEGTFFFCDTYALPTFYKCPAEMVFDSNIEQCVNEDGLPPCTQIGVFADVDDCRNYYTCIQTEKGWIQKMFTCPGRSMYSEHHSKCEDPCKWYKGEFFCASEGRFRDETDCRGFFECVVHESGFRRTKRLCPLGFFWEPNGSESTGGCVKKEESQCDALTPTTCDVPPDWCEPKEEEQEYPDEETDDYDYNYFDGDYFTRNQFQNAENFSLTKVSNDYLQLPSVGYTENGITVNDDPSPKWGLRNTENNLHTFHAPQKPEDEFQYQNPNAGPQLEEHNKNPFFIPDVPEQNKGVVQTPPVEVERVNVLYPTDIKDKFSKYDDANLPIYNIVNANNEVLPAPVDHPQHMPFEDLHLDEKYGQSHIGILKAFEDKPSNKVQDSLTHEAPLKEAFTSVFPDTPKVDESSMSNDYVYWGYNDQTDAVSALSTDISGTRDTEEDALTYFEATSPTENEQSVLSGDESKIGSNVIQTEDNYLASTENEVLLDSVNLPDPDAPYASTNLPSTDGHSASTTLNNFTETEENFDSPEYQNTHTEVTSLREVGGSTYAGETTTTAVPFISGNTTENASADSESQNLTETTVSEFVTKTEPEFQIDTSVSSTNLTDDNSTTAYPGISEQVQSTGQLKNDYILQEGSFSNYSNEVGEEEEEEYSDTTTSDPQDRGNTILNTDALFGDEVPNLNRLLFK